MTIKNHNKLEQTAFWLLCAIMFDCTAFGGGTIIEIFGIDIRMILFVLFFAVSLPLVLKNIKGLMTNGYFLLLIAWGIWLIVCTVRGIGAGNDTNKILSAWIGFASFVIFPGTICVLNSREKIRKLMKVMCGASALLALESIVSLIVYQVDVDAFLALNDYMIQEELGGCTIVDDTVVRIFLRSLPLMVVGCIFSLYFLVTEREEKHSWMYRIHIALCLFALLISYTRSIYLCAFVGAAVAVVGFSIGLGRGGAKRALKNVGAAVAMFLVLLLTCDLLMGGEFLSYGIYRTTGIDVKSKVESVMNQEETVPSQEETVTTQQETVPSQTDSPAKDSQSNDYDPSMDINEWSDNIRDMTENELYKRIGQHPLIGSGMGAVLEVRAELDGDNEYFFLDQAFKTGLIGIGLYVAPMILMLILLVLGFGKIEKADTLFCVAWFSSLMGIVAFSWLNPYLNGSNGIALYCCTIGVFSSLNKKQQITMKKK